MWPSAHLTTATTNIALWHRGFISSSNTLRLNKILDNLNKAYNSSLKVRVISFNNVSSTMEVHDFFHALKNYTVSDVMYVVTSLDLKATWVWSKMLANKDTMFVDIRNPGEAKDVCDQLFLANFLKLIPPASEKRLLLRKMTENMLCKKTIILTCPAIDQNKNNNTNTANLQKQFQKANEDMVYCIILECSNDLDSLFSLAKPYGLLGSRYRWFSLHRFERLDNFTNLPRNLISIVLDKSLDGEKQSGSLNMDFVSDALTLIAEANRSCELGYGQHPTKRDFLDLRFQGETGGVYFHSTDQVRLGTNYAVYQLISVFNLTGWLKIGMWENNSFDTNLMTWILNEVAKVTPPLLRIATKKSKPWMFFATEQGIDSATSECIVGMKCVNYTSYANESNNTYVEHCCVGMLVDLLQELMKRLEFQPRLHFVKDKKFGSLDATTNQWNGMVGEVLRGEADTALYSLTITERRARVVDFSYPIIATGSGILISVDKTVQYPTINYAFLRPFSKDLWLVTLAVLGATIVTLWLAERLNQSRVYNIFLRNRSKLAINTFIETISYGWGVFVQKVVQEGGPRTLGGRVVVGTFGFYMIIVLSSYTANLAAIKVVEEEKEEISGIYDDKFLNPTSDFRFTSSKFTATSDFFKLSPDPRLNKIYDVMKDRLVRTRAKALELLKSGEIQAFFEDTPSLHYMASQQEKCDLKVVGKSFGNSGYGMPFRRNSSWLRPVSNALQEMNEDGVVTELSKKWLEGSCVTKTSSNVAHALGLQNASGNLFLLAVFCVGSFFLLAFEVLFKKVLTKIMSRFSSYYFANDRTR